MANDFITNWNYLDEGVSRAECVRAALWESDSMRPSGWSLCSICGRGQCSLFPHYLYTRTRGQTHAFAHTSWQNSAGTLNSALGLTRIRVSIYLSDELCGRVRGYVNVQSHRTKGEGYIDALVIEERAVSLKTFDLFLRLPRWCSRHFCPKEKFQLVSTAIKYERRQKKREEILSKI